MTANVRIHTYSGLYSPTHNSSGRFVTDSVAMLKLPYLAGEVLTPDTSTAAASAAATAEAGTVLAQITVEPGKRVYYEVTPANADLATATSSSPIMEGTTQIQFGEGWKASFLEVA